MVNLRPASARAPRAPRDPRRHRALLGWLMATALLLTVAVMAAGLSLVNNINIPGPLQITTDSTGPAGASARPGFRAFP